MERGWNRASCTGSDTEPGHVFWYDTPSKSLSVPIQPPTRIRSEASALKQPTSSPSGVVSLPPGSTQAPWAARSQYSKWPISSENATLYECAAHGTRVCSLEVAYIGWNA